MKTTTRVISVFILTALFLSTLIHCFSFYGTLLIPQGYKMISRWLVLLLIIIYGWKKKSLTAWILISMLAGIEFGYDFPGFFTEA